MLLYLVVKCPCGQISLYVPQKKSNRPRKICPYCNKKFDVKKWLFETKDIKEATSFMVQFRQYQMDQWSKAPLPKFLRKVQREVKKTQKTLSDFSHDGPKVQGPTPTPVDQIKMTGKEELKAEVDWIQGSAIFKPELHDILIQRGHKFHEKRGCIPLVYSGCNFDVFSSGIVTFRVNSSQSDFIALADGILKWLGQLCGMDEIIFKGAGGIEATIRVPEGSPLVRKIEATLPPKTRMILTQPLGWFKAYKKEEEEEYWSLESENFKIIIRSIEEFMEEHIPNITFRDRFFMFFNEANTQALLHQFDQLQAQIGEQAQGQLQTNRIEFQMLTNKLMGLKEILEQLSGVQITLSSNLVQLTRYMDTLDGRAQEISQGVTDLLITRTISEAPGGRKLPELTQLLTYIHTEGECTIKKVCEHFHWSSGKAHRLLKSLMHLGELERRRLLGPGRGRPYYTYQKKED